MEIDGSVRLVESLSHPCEILFDPIINFPGESVFMNIFPIVLGFKEIEDGLLHLR